MKKVVSFLMWLLFILTTLYPAGVLITACFGYGFELISISAFAIVLAVLSVCIVVLDNVHKNALENKALRILLAIITPFSLINAVFYIFENPKIWVIAGVLISAGCCFYLTIKYGKPLALKIIALVLSALMVLPIGFISFILLIFGNIGQNTIVQTVESPSGKYYAQVIDSDQGALGGDTLVDVYEKSGINAILFKIEKKPQRVYFGEWGEFNNMQIYWKDDECLIINSTEYPIK
ncbi:MAG: hypothetical protein IJ356_02210 [Erysipelotrichaceae bacterium]|nr:hypothetical protein [Erysipelotrichaceae bacterium]